MKVFLFILFFLCVLLESTVIQIPLILSLLIVLFVLKKSEEVFVIAFISGILLDIVSLRPVGISSLFFICLLFLISLYDRKYEIKTLPFVIISSSLGSSLYLVLDKTSHIFILTMLSVIIASLTFIIAMLATPRVKKN